ncbi:MAG: ABC transporter permease subunit [Chloroflexi bacterium]|jgi:ABC-2 type transport system permease protein|nr:ABC transporter permease subunit [Chloroflexota bacterium]
MANVWTIAKREYKHFFTSPIAYAVAFMIFVILGILFYATIVSASYQQYAPEIQVVLSPLVTLLLFTTPAVTMRSLAEENKSGTLELLLTAPVRDWELVSGKWLGNFLFVLTIIAVSWIYPLILNQVVQPGIDQGMLVAGYVGVLLLSAAILGVGVAISSMFNNQIAAFFVTLGVLLVLWMINVPSQAAGGIGSEILRYIDFGEHYYNSFAQGIIELKDVVYYLSVTFLTLFLGTMSVETRRWR